MLLQDIQSHRIFTAFKDRRLELDFLICYPHGTGGNFIWDLVTNGPSDSAIEERNFDGVWMKLDHIPLARVESDLETHLETLCGVAETMNVSFPVGKTRSARCHFPPVLTDLIMDLRCEEMAFIEVRYEDKWFPTALSLIKNHLMTPWDGNPHLIELLLNHCIISGMSQRIMVTDYLRMIDAVSSQTADLPWSNSLLSWDYYIHCKQNGYVYGPDSLSRFLDAWIFRPDAYAYYSTDAYAATRDLFAGKVSRHTVVEYSDLFFGMEVPEGRMGAISDDQLKLYSKHNIKTVRTIAPLLGDDYSNMVVDRLDAWEAKL